MLTENDLIIIAAAPLGSLEVLDSGDVVKVLDRTEDRTWYVVMGCEAFRGCDSMATSIIDHPIIGQVPACERCRGILS